MTENKQCLCNYGVYAIPYDSCNSGLKYFDSHLTVDGVDEEQEGSDRFDYCPWCGEKLQIGEAEC